MNEQHIWSHRTPHHQLSASETDEWSHHRRLKINIFTICQHETTASVMPFDGLRTHLHWTLLYPTIPYQTIGPDWSSSNVSGNIDKFSSTCVWQQIMQIAVISNTARSASCPVIYGYVINKDVLGDCSIKSNQVFMLWVKEVLVLFKQIH